jgi:hypothetical protein
MMEGNTYLLPHEEIGPEVCGTNGSTAGLGDESTRRNKLRLEAVSAS